VQVLPEAVRMVDRAVSFVATLRCKPLCNWVGVGAPGVIRSMAVSQADMGITRPYQGGEFCRGGEPTTDRVPDHEDRLIGVRPVTGEARCVVLGGPLRCP
jgi:hypothetical protein